jgi:hypothetical protein
VVLGREHGRGRMQDKVLSVWRGVSNKTDTDMVPQLTMHIILQPAIFHLSMVVGLHWRVG